MTLAHRLPLVCMALVCLSPLGCKTTDGQSSIKDDAADQSATDLDGPDANPNNEPDPNDDSGEAAQTTTTPYSQLKSKLAMKAGQTYLAYMMNTAKPAMDSYDSRIRGSTNYQHHAYSALQNELIGEGSGVAIRIDAKNYIFNIGYNNGSTPADDVKSGRSYGVGPTNRQSDPSDLAYLTELGAYFQSEPNAIPAFVTALMKAVTNCDTSGWAGLSPAGQIVATDFMAIYTAELDRHLMVNLNSTQHQWEIDLAAATFVSPFVTATGNIAKDGTLTSGTTKDWWAKGLVGSGIGETRVDRIKLQSAIAGQQQGTAPDTFMQSVVPDKIKNDPAISRYSISGDDVIQLLLMYLNDFDTPADLTARAPDGADSLSNEISKAITDYVSALTSNASQVSF